MRDTNGGVRRGEVGMKTVETVLLVVVLGACMGQTLTLVGSEEGDEKGSSEYVSRGII